MERRNVGILGATGAVGEIMRQVLTEYAQACNWRLDTPLPAHIAQMVLQPNQPEGDFPRIIFSSVDSDIARELEPKFAAAGCAVISNSSAFRMAADVPLVVPEVNAEHFDVIESQPARKATGGFLVTNPNCCAIGLVLPLAPLEQAFGIEKLFVSTMQAVSGAGYPGVASLDILGNVIPYIKNEEDKLQEEVGKLLGAASADSFKPADIQVSAHCNRVAVLEGHTECVSIKLRKPATHGEILATWNAFQPLSGKGHEGLHLPSAPHFPVEYIDEQARPQPRLDLMRGNGMTTTVGRLRPCSLFDWKFTLLSHNTIRGAAGAAILNAEILAVLGKFDFCRWTSSRKAVSA